MANRTNCPECGKTNVKGKNLRPYVRSGAIMGGSIGGVCGSGIFSVPLATVGSAIGAVAGKIISFGAKKKFEYKCPRCGYRWEEEE